MGTQEIVVAIIFFIISFALIVLSIRHFLEKGFVFNGIQPLTGISAFYVVEIILFSGLIVYAIISSILIDKQNKAKYRWQI